MLLVPVPWRVQATSVKDQIQHVFKAFDVNMDGFIDVDELSRYLAKVCCKIGAARRRTPPPHTAAHRRTPQCLC